MPLPPDRLDDWLWRVVLVALGSVLMALGVWTCTLAWGEHTPDLRWMQGYRSAAGARCCSAVHCREAPVALVAQQGDTTTVLVYDVTMTLPSGSVHHSLDGASYWCSSTTINVMVTPQTTRCVFLATGS